MDTDSVNKMLNKYNNIVEEINNDLLEFIKQRPETWAIDTFFEYKSTESILSGEPIIESEDFIDPTTISMPDTNKRIFTNNHPRYEVEMEYLDNELDSSKLYKIRDPIIDINDFMIILRG